MMARSLLAVALALTTLIIGTGCRPGVESLPEPIPLAISRIGTPHSGLLHIAQARGYFTEEGLKVSMRTTSTGYEAIGEMVRGEADVAAAAEKPIARTLAEGTPVKVVATIFTSTENVGIVARRDRGIAEPEDLRGKRIGFVFGTATHYMLETFLAFNGIDPGEVTLVPTKPDAIEEALSSGTIDAAASWNPTLTRMRRELGQNGLFFGPGDFYAETYNLAVDPSFLPDNRETVDRLLRALIKAERFAETYPDEAWRIIAKASQADLEIFWKEREQPYELTLKQSLLLATEHQVRWLFRRGLVPAGPFPDLLDAFEPGPLRRLKPSAVTLVK
jgi:ABC-type nitrate/sulfonate/bicarbonate transport system substrate-binding protein